MSILSHGTPDSSSGDALAVTPHDSTNMAGKCRYLYVGTAGDLTFINDAGDPITLVGLAAGWHPIRTTRVNSTDTDAGDIVAFF